MDIKEDIISKIHNSTYADLPKVLKTALDTLELPPLIVYHANCIDGFASAFYAWRKFGDGAEYVPMHAGSVLGASYDNRVVYFLDISPTPAELREALKVAKRVVVIDHHASAIRVLSGCQHDRFVAVLDDKHSGAVLSGLHFDTISDRRDFADLVEDYDLWKFEYKSTKAFNAYMELVPYTFHEYNDAARACEDAVQRSRVMMMGDLVLAKRTRDVSKIVKDNAKSAVRHIKMLMGRDFNIVTINATANRNEISDLILAERNEVDVVCVWAVYGPDIRISLRSRKGGIDVSKLAAKWAPNGGGHPSAAGCTLVGGAADVTLPWLE